MNLARYFSGLRTDTGLSLRDVAAKARPKLDPVSIWKIEKGRPVRAKTLGQALRALGLTEADRAYIEAFAHWSTEQAQTMPHAQIDLGIARVRRSRGKDFDRLLDLCTTALRKVAETDRPAIVEALKHPEALALWVRSRK